MSSEIPFLSTDTDCKLAGQLHPDAQLFRVGLGSLKRLDISPLPHGKLWIDPEIDAMDKDFAKVNETWRKNIKKFHNHESVTDRARWKSPDKDELQVFVSELLDSVLEYAPTAITVPQIPLTTDVSRNRMNWALAQATSTWRSERGFIGFLIIPVIITSQHQVNTKTERNKRISSVAKSFEYSGANGLWTVDASLSDQSGASTLVKRFKGLIAFQQELNAAIPHSILRVAGPYWGLNLVLWARQLVDSPAIGVGKAYQYHISGGKGSPPKTRIAISSLRRWVQRNNQFRKWMDDAMETMATNSPEYLELFELKRRFDVLASKEASRKQIANSYKGWLEKIEQTPAKGRSLTLYQELSQAYVLGKTLPTMPSVEKTARRPEKVAEHLMLCCL